MAAKSIALVDSIVGQIRLAVCRVAMVDKDGSMARDSVG